MDGLLSGRAAPLLDLGYDLDSMDGAVARACLWADFCLAGLHHRLLLFVHE